MFVGFFIPSAGYPACSTVGQTGCIPNVTNPWDELTKGLGYQTTTSAGGSVTQTNTPENIRGTAAIQGCAIGGAVGSVTGAIAGVLLGLGIASVPGGVVGFIGG